LHESEHLFKNIYENLSLGIRSFDVQKSEIMMVSIGVEEISGYPPSFFYDKYSWESIIHSDDVCFYLKKIKSLQEGIGFEIQYRIYHKNGNIVWINDKTIPVLNEQGELKRVDGIVSDITFQKEAELKMKHLAYYDTLTDLPNRSLLTLKIETLIE